LNIFALLHLPSFVSDYACSLGQHAVGEQLKLAK